MRKIILALVLFTPMSTFSQEIKGKIVDQDTLSFPGVIVEIFKEEKLFSSTQTDYDGNFIFKNLTKGNFNIKMTYVGMRDQFTSIQIRDGENNFTLVYPIPCIKTKKVCPKNHTDNIIPITYGLPTKKTMNRAKRGKVKLGGCDPSYCEKWHCKIHDIDF